MDTKDIDRIVGRAVSQYSKKLNEQIRKDYWQKITEFQMRELKRIANAR